jgi:hypothetical protein
MVSTLAGQRQSAVIMALNLPLVIASGVPK